MTIKVCRKCGLSKDLDKDFNGNANTADKKQPDCRSCMSTAIGNAVTRAYNRKSGDWPVQIDTKRRGRPVGSKNKVIAKSVGTGSSPVTSTISTSNFSNRNNTIAPAMPITSNNNPQFIQIGHSRFINTNGIIDVDDNSTSVDVVLSVQDMSPQGFPVARALRLFGDDRIKFLASLNTVSGLDNSILETIRELSSKVADMGNTVNDLRAENDKLKIDRDAALDLAGTLEKKVAKMRETLN